MPAPRLPSNLVLLTLAVSVGTAVGHVCTSAMPLQIGSLMDGFGLSASSAGFVGFCQIASLAASMMLVSPIAHRFRLTTIAVAGLLVGFLCNGLLYLPIGSLPLICVIAALGGCGYGLILTAAVGAAAASPQADKIYAAAVGGSLLIVVGLLSLLPLAGDYLGPRGTFLGIASLIAVSSPLVSGFRQHQSRGAVRQEIRFPLRGGLPLLIVWCLFSFGTGAVWSFAERIGHALALRPSVIGLVLSGSVFVGLFGTVLAAWLAERVPRGLALAVGLAGTGIACLLLAFANGLVPYAAGAVLYWVFTMFIYVALLGAAAALDPTGRLGTLGTGCERMAFAIGAPIGGLLVDAGSTSSIGVLAAVACGLAVPLCLSPLARATQQPREAPT